MLKNSFFYLFLLFLLQFILIFSYKHDDGFEFFHFPWNKFLANSPNIILSEFNEVKIVSNSSYSALANSHTSLNAANNENIISYRIGDLISHADGIPVLQDTLENYLTTLQHSHESSYQNFEVLLPIIDTNPADNNKKLIGFLKVQPIFPRKITIKRGEVDFSKVKYNIDESTGKPEVLIGGGFCLSSNDCKKGNGICRNGRCVCKGWNTGKYCEVSIIYCSSLISFHLFLIFIIF